jgi:hypothetical protein
MIHDNEKRRPGRPRKSETQPKDNAGFLHVPPVSSYADKDYPELKIKSKLTHIARQLTPAMAAHVLYESMRAEGYPEEAVAQMCALTFTLIAKHAHAKVLSQEVVASCAILLDGRLQMETTEEVSDLLLSVLARAGYEPLGIRTIAERMRAQCVVHPLDDVLSDGGIA